MPIKMKSAIGLVLGFGLWIAVRAQATDGIMARGWELYQKEQFRQAAQAFDELLAANPDDKEAMLGRGWAALNQGQLDVAEVMFRKLADGDPVHIEANAGLTICLLRGHRLAEAENAAYATLKGGFVTDVKKSGPAAQPYRLVSPLRREARLANAAMRRSREKATAEECLALIATGFPISNRPGDDLGDIMFDPALNIVNRALDRLKALRSDDIVPGLMHVAILLNISTDEKPPSGPSHFAPGSMLNVDDLYVTHKALDEINVILGRQPDNAEALGLRAFIFARMGRWQESIVDLRRAVATTGGAKEWVLTLKRVEDARPTEVAELAGAAALAEAKSRATAGTAALGNMKRTGRVTLAGKADGVYLRNAGSSVLSLAVFEEPQGSVSRWVTLRPKSSYRLDRAEADSSAWKLFHVAVARKAKDGGLEPVLLELDEHCVPTSKSITAPDGAEIPCSFALDEGTKTYADIVLDN